MNSNNQPEFILCDHIMKHLFTYVRLVALMISWLFIEYEPFIFIAIILFTLSLGFGDKIISSVSVIAPVTDMLFLILEKITSSMVIFAVITAIKSQKNPTDLNNKSFLWVSVFMLDFVSSWFRVYSIYLAGPRTEKVSNRLENLILSVYRGSQTGHMIITLLAEVWVLTYFIKYSDN